MNASLRRIDLLSNLLTPLVVAGLDQSISLKFIALILGGSCLISLPVIFVILRHIYYANPNLALSKTE